LAYYLAKEIQNSLAHIYSSELTKLINKSEEKPDANIRYIPKQPIVAQQIINV
jgi:hypothetical protein